MGLRGFYTLTRREIYRFMRLYPQTILPPVITAVLYILVFGIAFGKRVSINGTGYIEFIIPGLMMMGVIQSSYSNTSSSIYIAKFGKHIEEVLIAPMTNIEVTLAYMIGGVVRGLLVGAGILVVSMLFANIAVDNILLVLFFVLATSVLFSLAGLITGLWAETFDQLGVFNTFLLMPLIYLGGVFYSIKMLPTLWQRISIFNPILYMINGFRYGFLGISDVNIFFSAIFISAIAVVLFIVCVALIRRGYKLRT